jgi:hypothetical protein
MPDFVYLLLGVLMKRDEFYFALSLLVLFVALVLFLQRFEGTLIVRLIP